MSICSKRCWIKARTFVAIVTCLLVAQCCKIWQFYCGIHLNNDGFFHCLAKVQSVVPLLPYNSSCIDWALVSLSGGLKVPGLIG